MEIKELLQQAEDRMNKSIEALKHEFASIRTGRASVALLDKVMVDYYGSPSPINQVANISVPEPRMIVIAPWDKTMIGAIEKAILQSDLGLNPGNDGAQIRLSIPQLTEERRKEIVKVVHKKAEDAKVAVRNIRRDVNEALKKENNIIIAVSEGVKTADGNYVGEETKSGKEDVFGHKYLSGVGKYLEGLVGEKIGCKVRSVELNILQRCAGYMLSETDIMESRNLGAFAAVSAIRGKSGKMSAVRRISDDPYQVEIVLSDLSKIANYEKKVPMEWINEEGNDIKDELLTYLKPLIQGEVQIPYEKGIPKRFIL